MVSKYGSKSKLLFTDTDSLCYNVKTWSVSWFPRRPDWHFRVPKRTFSVQWEKQKRCWEKWQTRPMEYSLRNSLVSDPRCTPSCSLKTANQWKIKQLKAFPRKSPSGWFRIRIANHISSRNNHKWPEWTKSEARTINSILWLWPKHVFHPMTISVTSWQAGVIHSPTDTIR